MRGFEQNTLGPLTEGGDSLGGQAVAVLNQELRFPIWKRVHGGVFWDAGNVWLTSSELLPHRPAPERRAPGCG